MNERWCDQCNAWGDHGWRGHHDSRYRGSACESCGAPAEVLLIDGSMWCVSCDIRARSLGYDNLEAVYVPAEPSDAGAVVGIRCNDKATAIQFLALKSHPVVIHER